MSIATITPKELANLCEGDRKIELIDVRTPMEFRGVHAVPAQNVPLDQLDPKAIMQSRGSSNDPLYIICHSGSRAKQACEKFIKAGCSKVVNVEGGTQAWEACGLPVVRGPKSISLERQVRIATGALVCLGALLSWFVHPGWIALSAFVGAGLVFAGITDTCAMGLMLARMPWNRGRDTTKTCSGN